MFGFFVLFLLLLVDKRSRGHSGTERGKAWALQSGGQCSVLALSLRDAQKGLDLFESQFLHSQNQDNCDMTG